MSGRKILTDKGQARPTIRDVARLSGVSVGTVSAVLNNRDGVLPETRQRVASCITALGFEPSNTARMLTRRHSSAIGFVVPDIANPFFAAVAEGVQQGAAESDVLMVLCLTASSAEKEGYYAQVQRTQRLDGIVYLTGSGAPSASLIQLARKGLVVFVDECLPGIDAPSVTSRNLSGARSVATMVLEKGHTALAIIAGPPRLWTSEQRLAGYREAIAASGQDPDTVSFAAGDYSEQSGYDIAARFLDLDRARRPTAIFCANDLMAIGVIKRCRELRLRIPEDISITGFDDIPVARILDPPLSTVSQPARDMGFAAASLLLHATGRRSEPPATVEFGTTVHIRGTT